MFFASLWKFENWLWFHFSPSWIPILLLFFCENCIVSPSSLVEVRLKSKSLSSRVLFTCCTFLLFIFQIPFRTHFIRDFANKPAFLHSGARPTMAEKVLRRTSYGGEQSENMGNFYDFLNIVETKPYFEGVLRGII